LTDRFVRSFGGTSLAPMAERFIRVVSSAIVNAVSSSVRGAVDPSAAEPQGGKRKRWLHFSIALRSQAVKSFRSCLEVFGGDLSRSCLHGSRSATSLTERGIMLVCGVVVEELNVRNASVSQCWGSSSERSDLLVAATSCLESFLSTGSEYMSLNVRQLVDSVAKHALLTLVGSRTEAMSSSSTKHAAVSLCTTCVVLPWPDGTCSWLVNDLLSAARQNLNSSETDHIYRRAIQICNAALCPRVPALCTRTPVRHIPTHGAMREITVESLEQAINKGLAPELAKDSLDVRPEKADNAKRDTPLLKKAVSAKMEQSASLPTNVRKRPLNEDNAGADASATRLKLHVEPSRPLDDDDAKEAEPLNDNDEDNFDLPMIVDAGPDEGDEDDGSE
jgi:hypothetical protein